jgi:DNA end-binding protein Ku
MARSIWNGCLGVGALRVPVKLYGAVESKTIRFREVHLEDAAPLEHRRIDPQTGETVPYDHIVKGFEIGEGRYVVLTDEEIQAAAGKQAKLAEIEAFVPAEQIDPVFYDHPYYLGPRNRSEEGYRLLHDALARADRVGIGRIVLRTRERLVALRALEHGVLGLTTMRFADELVDPQSFDVPEPQHAPARREVDMARALVGQLTQPFDPTDYEDEYRAAVLELIERKAEGEPVRPPEEEPPGVPDDLEAALQAMLAEAERQRRPARGGARRRRRPAAATRRGGTRRAPARRRAPTRSG